MLKPGGETFNLFFAEAPSDRPFDNLLKNPKWAKYENEKHASPYYADPNILEIYRKCLYEAGFVDCVVQPEEYVHKFTTASEYQGQFGMHKFFSSGVIVFTCAFTNISNFLNKWWM